MDPKGVEQLKRHEGLRLHAYADSLGYTTIGYGRMIDKRKGGGITEREAGWQVSITEDSRNGP